MSRLPLLEAQLVAAAAAAHPRPKARAPRRIAAGLMATACAAAALLIFAPRRDAVPAQVADPFPTVPAATLARSRELTTEPKPVPGPDDAVPHAEVPAVVAGIMARTPYPPGMRDGYDWGSPSAPLSSMNVGPSTLQSVVEYRSYCLWLKYWLAAQGVPAAEQGAAQVIADVFHWPTQRQTDPYELTVQADKLTAVQAGDVAPIRREVDLNCRSV
jgi:hypothetical protein